MTTLLDLAGRQAQDAETRLFRCYELVAMLQAEADNLAEVCPAPEWEPLRQSFRDVLDYMNVTAGMTNYELCAYLSVMGAPPHPETKPDCAVPLGDLVTNYFSKGCNAMIGEKGQNIKHVEGMERALMHAFDMNKNGKLDNRELDEFRRYLITETLNNMPMEDYLKGRENGNIDKLIAESRQNPRDDKPVDERTMMELRKGIAKKIVADYIGSMWDDGHIDDAAYADQMRKIGMAPVGDDADAQKPDTLAAKVWEAANGQAPAAEPSPQEVEAREMDEYAQAYHKRLPRR